MTQISELRSCGLDRASFLLLTLMPVRASTRSEGSLGECNECNVSKINRPMHENSMAKFT